ncbi:MAG: 16S rRNA (guanine(527)-N(7))-methyltransferase RsmG [Planctomycetota bacterium]|jgi:16S rRNA (guanine527-N7)-methyltransferase
MKPRSADKEKKTSTIKPSPKRLDALCRFHGLQLTPEQIDRLWTFHQMLRERNRELNMTRIHNFENMVAKHYVDSMLVARMADLPSPLLDIGTGAGFPGIPLKIFRPDLEIILVEGRKKRVEFLQEVLKRLELPGIEAIAKKIENHFEMPVAGVITRAFETAPKTLDRVKSFLPEGGLVVFMKGPRCDEEVLKACENERDEYDLLEDKAYIIPETTHRRRLLIFRRKEGATLRSAAAFKGTVHRITSSSNRMFSSWKKLTSARGIRKACAAILHGERIVEEALCDHPGACKAWITDEKGLPPREDAPEHLGWYKLAPPLFKELDLFGTGKPLLLVETPSMPDWSPEDAWPRGCTLFIPFQDPENVGSVIRSAAAFGAARVVLLEEAAHPFLPKACRAAGTALLKVPLYSGPSIRELEAYRAPVFALSKEGRSIRKFAFPKAFGLLAGLEGLGLPGRFRNSEALSIPIEEDCESLNAATSVAVALYAWRSQQVE